jgi:hypothetical protein
MQDAQRRRLASIGDAIFRDGDIVRGASCRVDGATGTVSLAAGDIYLAGCVRSIADGAFIVPIDESLTIGVKLTTSHVTELDDPTLASFETGQSFGLPGAHRERIATAWTWSGAELVAGESYYPVYTVENGILLLRDPPPQFDATTQALARYDRDSAGGSYIVEGLDVSASFDGSQVVYLIGEGRGRVNGYGIEIPTAVRMAHATDRDLQIVTAEPRTYSPSGGSMRINVDSAPLVSVSQVRILAEKTVIVSRGVVAGGKDPLPDASVLSIVSVTQGATTFGAATYQLTAGQIDWAPAGAEPAPGSAYSVKYQYQTTATPTAVDADGFTITGAVTGSLVQTDYNYALPRIDSLVIDDEGRVTRVKGVASRYTAAPPTIPAAKLQIATVAHNWRNDPTVTRDAVVVVNMRDLGALQRQIGDLYDLVAQNNLRTTVGLEDPAAKRGVFVDPLLNDNLRDAGTAQDAAAIDGELRLAIAGDPVAIGESFEAPILLDYELETVVEQTRRTGAMKVNPYAAFEPLQGNMRITPPVDFWTETRHVNATRAAEFTGRFLPIVANVSVRTADAALLRPIDIAFAITGFAAGETLTSLQFDGIDVTPSPALTADANGAVDGTFTIPANLPAGTKRILASGNSGSTAEASFTGRGTIRTEARRRVFRAERRVDPLAQTLTLPEGRHIAGVDLWFVAAGASTVLVQIRDTAQGIPGQDVLAEARLAPSEISTVSHTRVVFPSPVWLDGGLEFAIVVLTDDADASLAVAELGKLDPTTGTMTTSQPYQVGVLLSSSNASTWTPHNDRDLAFRLLACRFTSPTRTVALGTVDASGVTDLVSLASIEMPATGTAAGLVAVADGGATYQLPPQVPVGLAAPLTGNLAMSLQLAGTEKTSPIVYPGMAVALGTQAASGVYVSRSFAVGSSSKVAVRFQAMTPGTSAILVEIQISGVWTTVPLDSAADAGGGWSERTHKLASVTTTTTKLRITLTGSAQYRPRLRSLRAVATE